MGFRCQISVHSLVTGHSKRASHPVQAAMADDLASVAVAGVWWSSKQRLVPLTLVTQVEK